MPSGTKINWSKYEELFRNELPNHTLVEFSRKFIPHVSVKAVGKQARKLQVKHKQYCPSPEHKKKIATFITKETPEILLGIRNLVDANSNVKISKELSISVATLWEASFIRPPPSGGGRGQDPSWVLASINQPTRRKGCQITTPT